MAFLPMLMLVVPKPDLSALKARARVGIQAAFLKADISQLSVSIDTGLDESHVSRQLKRGINLYTWLAVRNKALWQEIVNFIREEIGLDDKEGELPLRERVAQQEQRIAQQQQQIDELADLVRKLVTPKTPAEARRHSA